MNTDYQVEAINILLNEDCILSRFVPLLPYREKLVQGVQLLGCQTKTDCLRLSDDDLFMIGLPDTSMIQMFRRFLVMYEIDPKKLKEIERSNCTPEEAAAFRELYHLPGVKITRARLYYLAGFRSLADLACVEPDEVIRRTTVVIQQDGLSLKPPLPKEVRTHIAVAKAFISY